ncbi:hypothetical protein [Emticicia sp. C21]|uniref:hypothetical protein n=1 Tax=Emticicia sp. C21 TaxID=2302915 RepID=UPI000E35660F|nr:hypothetical protein [Emticicia sp. C21]RFS14505.1 hypothetical protein D0T08_21790 [Emticicia sp. C21]
MKKLTILIIALLTTQTLWAQTILSGSELFGKDRKDGFYMTLSTEKKFIEKDWPLFLAKYGSVSQNRDIYNIASASIPDLTSEPVNLMTKIISDQKTKTKVFASFDIAGTPVSSGSSNYYEVEKFMKEFYAYAMQNEDVRLAERDADESQKNFERVEKTGKRILRDIERNKREKETLLRKIEENKQELEKLLQDEIANKQDMENAKIALEEKQKSLSTVKTRKP